MVGALGAWTSHEVTSLELRTTCQAPYLLSEATTSIDLPSEDLIHLFFILSLISGHMGDQRPKNLFDLRNRSTVRNRSGDRQSIPNAEREAVQEEKTQAKLRTYTLINACLEES